MNWSGAGTWTSSTPTTSSGSARKRSAWPARGRDSSIQARFQTADGGYAWLDAVGREVPATDGRQAYRVVRLRNVDRLMEEQEQLTYEAHHDPMTGLLAGHEARRRVSRMAERCRQEGRGLAIAYCDLDGLKEINDTHGHAAGDEYIRAVCQRMTETLRDGDLVGRLGATNSSSRCPGSTVPTKLPT